MSLTRVTGYLTTNLVKSFKSVADMALESGVEDGAIGATASFHEGEVVGGNVYVWTLTSPYPADGIGVVAAPTGFWTSTNRHAMDVEQCGALQSNTGDQNSLAMDYWASQNHPIGVKGTFKSGVSLNFKGVNPWVEFRGMKVSITTPNINGITAPANSQTDIQIKDPFIEYAAPTPGLTATTSNGILITGMRRLTLHDARAEGWSNSGARIAGNRTTEVVNFFGWRNDWDGSSEFATGGDFLLYTGTPGESKSTRVSGLRCYSDASQSIIVNSLSADRNVIVEDFFCDTYKSDVFEPKDFANIRKRHGVTIGYVSHQTYGGSVIVDTGIVRGTNWTAIYRSGGSLGNVAYPPCKINNVQAFDVALKIDASNIGGGILLGDSVAGDMISNCYVCRMSTPTKAAYVLQDSVGDGNCTVVNCVDEDSAGYGVNITGDSANVLIKGHRSINPASHSIFLQPRSGTTTFGAHVIEGCYLQRKTKGYGIITANGIASTCYGRNNTIINTNTDDATDNVGVYCAGDPDTLHLELNLIRGFAWGVWCNTLISATRDLPWGTNTFNGVKNGYRLAATSGSFIPYVAPNKFYNVTNKFANGGSGSNTGAERMPV